MTALGGISLRGRMWVGVAGAPLAWIVQHITGYALTEAMCGPNGPGSRDIGFAPWTAAVAAVAAVIAVTGIACSLTVVRETRDAQGEDDPPPRSRIHFLGIIGLAISPLFLCIILMSGLGAVLIDACRQS